MPELQTFLGAVDENTLMTHVRRLAEHVRMPGGNGEERAFAYLRETLVSYGTAPSLHMLPAYISLPESAGLAVAGEDIPCTTHSMLPDADLEAELAPVSGVAGITPAAVAGKIVMIESLAMAPVLAAAERAGAVGAVFVAGSRCCHEMIVSTVWGSPEPKDLGAYAGIPAVTVRHADGERIKELLHKTATVSMRTRVDTKWMDIPVLTADIGDVSGGYVLLTGHVDSWHKGAMDNASGNAAALEIARILAADPALLRRGLRLVFWSGHSHGRYAGSAAFCDEFFQDIHDNAFLHVNADCLGGAGATLLTQGGCMAETWALGASALRAVTGEELEGTRFSRSCDQSFWGTGTPSLFSSVSEQPKPLEDDAASRAFSLMFGGSKSGGYGWWWHTEADTPDIIDPAFLARDTRVILAAVHGACFANVIPIDIRAGFAEVAAQIREYAATAGALVNFKPLLAAVEEAETLLETFDTGKNGDAAANAFIMRFEQLLVPLAYVKGSPYGHDPARTQLPVPLLEEARALPPETDPHRKNALRVLLKRRCNAVTATIRDMIILLREGV